MNIQPQDLQASPDAPGWRARRRSRTVSLAPVGFGIFALLVSMAFFLEGRRASFSALSGDQVNILTICARLDHPELLSGDLIAGDVNRLRFYTPFFVSVVRFCSLPDHNYLRGLNILLLLTSLLYLWGWWLLFSLWGDKVIAALLAFLARGIMWPPGYEVWGIAGLWTMLPRTLFTALLPWGFWAWFRWRGSPRLWLMAFVFVGLLTNVHPISGACLAVGMGAAEFFVSWVEHRGLTAAFKRTATCVAAMLVGMAPYIWTYWSNLGSMAGVDPSEFEQALRLRVGDAFLEPGAYLKLWLRPRLLALILMPWALWLALPRRYLSEYKHVLGAMAAVAGGCVFTAIAPFFFERLLRGFGHDAHFAFQLVRSGKYLLVPALIVGGLGCLVVCREAGIRFKFGKAATYGVAGVAFVSTLAARHPVFDRVPYLGNDVCRMLWPGRAPPAQQERDNNGLDAVLAWIRHHTAEETRFIGPRLIRVGALRPVIHDWPGAGMLIEGNPKAFIQAWKRQRAVRVLEKQNPRGLPELYAEWGADFWVTKLEVPDLPVAFGKTPWWVYDLRQRR